MKRTALILSSMLFFAPLFANLIEGPQARRVFKKKYYCSADQIEVTNSMIVAYVDNMIVEIDSLMADQGGIYFTDDVMRCIDCRKPLQDEALCQCVTH